jgi:hypothetical protein
MHCQRILLPIFLFIYIVTGIILAIAAFILHSTKYGYNQYGSYLSLPGRYYIGLASLYILFTCIIQLIAIICCKRKSILFRLAVGLLIFGIILELTAVAIIVFMRSGIDPDIRKKTLIVVSSLTCYLVILQIYGVVASLSYHAESPHNYREVSLK